MKFSDILLLASLASAAPLVQESREPAIRPVNDAISILDNTVNNKNKELASAVKGSDPKDEAAVRAGLDEVREALEAATGAIRSNKAEAASGTTVINSRAPAPQTAPEPPKAPLPPQPPKGPTGPNDLGTAGVAGVGGQAGVEGKPALKSRAMTNETAPALKSRAMTNETAPALKSRALTTNQTAPEPPKAPLPPQPPKGPTGPGDLGTPGVAGVAGQPGVGRKSAMMRTVNTDKVAEVGATVKAASEVLRNIEKLLDLATKAAESGVESAAEGNLEGLKEAIGPFIESFLDYVESTKKAAAAAGIDVGVLDTALTDLKGAVTKFFEKAGLDGLKDILNIIV